MVLKWLGSREGMRRVMASTSLCHLICLQCFCAQLALLVLQLTVCCRGPNGITLNGHDHAPEQGWVTAPTPLLYPVEWK